MPRAWSQGASLGLLLLLLPTSPLLAVTPRITGISGPFTAGATVTISGSGFGTKQPARPFLWVTFERGPSATAEPLSLGVLQAGAGELTTLMQPPNSQWSWRGAPGVLTEPSFGTNVSLATDVSLLYPNGIDHFYLFVRRLYDDPHWWDTPLSEYRLLRVWAGTCTRYAQPDFVLTLSEGQLTFHSEGTAPPTRTAPRFPPAGHWIREEYQGFQGSREHRDATIAAWWDGAVVLDATFQGRSAQYPALWGCVRVENLEAGNRLTGREQYVYLDDLYLDTTFARVMLCTSPTWGACTDREPQLPVAWSEHAITIQVNQGALANLNAAYLYVVNPEGEANYAGVPITPAAAQGPAPPSGPSGPPSSEPPASVPPPVPARSAPPLPAEQASPPAGPERKRADTPPDAGRAPEPDPSDVIDWLLRQRPR